MRQVRLILDFYHPWTNAIGLYVARAEALFAEAKLEVEVFCGDPARGDALAHLDRGEVDFGVSYPNRVLAWPSDVLAVAALNDRPLESIVFRSDAPITRARELIGKRVAYRRSPRMTALLNHLVKADGGHAEEVEHLVLYPAEPMPEDVMKGRFDVAFGALWAWEGLSGWVSGLPVAGLGIVELGAPRYPAQVIAVRGDHDPGLTRVFLKCVAEGYRRAVVEREAALATLFEIVPYLPRDLQSASFDFLVDSWQVGSAWGCMRSPHLEAYRRWLVSVNLAPEGIAVGDRFREDFL